MISIAICDDDSAVIGQIERFIREARGSPASAVEVAAFSCGAELCAALDKGKYFDLVYMDIEMDNVDGIETGRLLREKHGHDSTLLIYVSNHTKYHGRLFDVQPFHFIQKPIEPDEFARKLKQAVKKIESGNEVFSYKKGRNYYQVKKRDIITLESRGHNLLLSLSDGQNIEYRGVFKQDAEKLNNTFFIQPHAAYIVNINHVMSFCGTHMIMDNGCRVPISEHRIKTVKDAYLRFWEK